MADRTAMTGPLSIGQQLVARWEGHASGWSEPADLAEAIDAAIAAEREACANIAEHGTDEPHPIVKGHVMRQFGRSPAIASAIRARGDQP